MTQGYGPEDPNRPGQGQPPSYPPPPPYGQPLPGAFGQPGYGADRPGYYMGHQLANWLQRVGAFLIDLLVFLIPLVILVAISAAASNGGASTISGSTGLLVYLLLLVAFGIYIYNRWILQGRTGQSWGKQALGLKVLRMDNGQPMGGGLSLVRDLAHFLDFVPCYIGYLWPLWDDRRQTFSDKVVNTVVIAD